MKPRRTVGAVDLSREDFALLVYGPWDDAAGIDQTAPLHHPRVRTERLRLLWAQHGEAVRAEAARQGLREPWVVGRLWFVDRIRKAERA